MSMKLNLPAISGILSLLLVAVSYLILNFYVRSAGHELVESWIQTEQINLQEGNYIAAIAKSQRIIASSSFIRGAALVDRTQSHTNLAEFGAKFEIPEIPFQPEVALTIQNGLFSFFEIRFLNRKNSLISVFLIEPKYAAASFALISIIIVGLGLSSLVILQKFERSEAEQRESRLAAKAAFGQLAKQIAHDVASPISALNIVSSSKRIAHLEEAALLRNAAQRIKDISQELLHTHVNLEDHKKIESLNLREIVEPIITEKKIEWSTKPGVLLTLEGAPSIRGRANRIELGRVISNIINNSYEAISNGGNIAVELLREPGYSTISIIDSGSGIPPELINPRSIGAVSIGKTDGHGLGLSHARSCCAEWNGQLTITNREVGGTKISIRLEA